MDILLLCTSALHAMKLNLVNKLLETNLYQIKISKGLFGQFNGTAVPQPLSAVIIFQNSVQSVYLDGISEQTFFKHLIYTNK